MSVPLLRFKDEAGQDFAEWEISTIGERVNEKSSKFNPEKQADLMKCIELEHLSQNTGELLGCIDTSNVKSIKNKFEKGDVLFGKLRPYLKKYLKAPFSGVCSTEIWVLKGKKISNEYLFQFVQTENFITQANISSGSKMPRADWGVVSSAFAYFPCSDEQTKIANFLTAVDEKIAQLSQKHDLLNQYKKGLMQQIFSQELRFKDDDGVDFPEWELSELGEFIDEFKEKSTVENQHRVLTSARTGLVPQDEYFEEGRLSRKDNLGFNIVPLGFVTYRSRSDDGIFKFNLNTLGYTGIISTYYPVFNLINCSNKFFIELTEFYKGDFGKYSVGTSQTVLSLNVLKKIEFMFPCFNEQTKIANFLTAIDDKITATQTQLQAVKQYKQGLLQQMFV